MSHPSAPTSARADAGFPRPFGKYLLVHTLGEGGMGAVFLAKAGGVAGIEKLCVVKTLRPALLADDDYAARFLDEARLVVQLAHRNICAVFDVGSIDGRYYLAMEHVAGRDLRRILARCRERGHRLSEGAALHLMTEVVDALDYAHRLHDSRSGDPLHLVHRDVSPQNIMVNFEGEVKLIDFGLALSTIKGQKTEPHSVMGKIAYMAPEHARGDVLDGRADQFSAAIVLYEALTATRYYGDLTPHEIWGVSGTGEHRPQLLDTLGEDLRAIFLRSLARHPNERFPSCGALREALEAALLARGVKTGDARRELRDLMSALFEEERQAERQLLAELATADVATLASAGAPAESSAPSTPAIDGFFDVTSPVRTSSEVVPSRGGIAVDGVTDSHLKAAGLVSQPRSTGVLVGIALAAAVFLTATFVWSGTDDANDPTTTAATPASASTSTEAAGGQVSPDAAKAAARELPATREPAAASVAPTAEGPTTKERAEPSERADTTQKADDAERAQPRRTSREQRASQPRASASKKAQRRPEPPTGYKGMLDYVKRWCAEERCTAEVLAHDEAMRAKGEPSTEDLLRAVTTLRRCVERCAR